MRNVVRVVNTQTVMAYWLIGREIPRNFYLYTKQLLATVSGRVFQKNFRSWGKFLPACALIPIGSCGGLSFLTRAQRSGPCGP